MNELKPCPICGEKAVIISADSGCVRVGCSNTECIALVENMPKFLFTQNAIDSWNRGDHEYKIAYDMAADWLKK